jgi:hypothetical protein
MEILIFIIWLLKYIPQIPSFLHPQGFNIKKEIFDIIVD